MAKARTTDKSGAKKASTTKVAPTPPPKSTKAAVASSKAVTPKAASKSAEEATSKAARQAERPTDAGPMASAKPLPDAGQVRAHPDAKLSKTETQTLFQKLVEERNRVLSGFDRHVAEALEDGDVLADEIDIAQRSTDQAWLFRFADKERKLLIEIEAALEKMRTGEYGLCEGTDEPIGFKRLELRPWTRYSVGHKELLEREKAQHTR